MTLALVLVSLLVVALGHAGPYVCLHDEMEALYPVPEDAIAQNTLMTTAKFNSRGKRDQINYANAVWDNMRVTIDMSNVQLDVQGSPRYGCSGSGGSITISGGSSYTCTEDDVLTDAKRTYLESMLLQAAAKLSALRVMSVDNFKTATGVTNCAGSTYLRVPGLGFCA